MVRELVWVKDLEVDAFERYVEGDSVERVAAGVEEAAIGVVIPSLPGFGFSGPLSGLGWDSRRIATAFAELMHRLGYEGYGAQGGDFGAFIAPDLGRVDPHHAHRGRRRGTGQRWRCRPTPAPLEMRLE